MEQNRIESGGCRIRIFLVIRMGLRSLISETVRDGAKRTKILFCLWGDIYMVQNPIDFEGCQIVISW